MDARKLCSVIIIRTVLLLLFILFNNSFYSQDKARRRSIDSLSNIIKDKNVYADKGSKEILRLCTEIYYQSKEINYNKGILQAILKMSEVYMNERNYELSLKKISEGKVLSGKENDNVALSSFLLEEGMIYGEMGYTKKSRYTLQQSLELADKLPGQDLHVKKAAVYRSMARNIRQEGNVNHYDSIFIYLNKGYSESKKMNHNFSYKPLYLASFAMDMAKEYFLTDKISESEKCLNDFQTYMKNERDKSEFIYYYLLKGSIENKKKNYNTALEYFDQSRQIVNEYKIYTNALEDIYSGQADAYQGLKDYKNEAVYSTKAKKITDSISSSEKKILNNIVTKGDIEYRRPENLNYNYWLFILPCSLGAAYIFFRKKKKEKENEFVKHAEDELPAEEYNVFFEENLTPQEKDKHELEVQDLKGLIELVQSNDKSFHLRFHEHFPSFNQRLLSINQQLTHSDLEYCALIKLKFDTKEIAQYKNVSVSSVFSKKYRIRKKLNINTDENMYTWMFNIG
ncbi:hypothetical protein [Chryseobacterium sediminis]|uniref:helix-turn-helix transcriptional regulator n=1 Tax=Chryseobacterium sediminis TaxID=1679494 RepID=UPI002862FDBD|nr:hypothetical protein [Chryseobacterium sediminis]MDR6466149.1 tetratricopeptide (TPR) repeat protein [Chryseobacterium sediminis]